MTTIICARMQEGRSTFSSIIDFQIAFENHSVNHDIHSFTFLKSSEISLSSFSCMCASQWLQNWVVPYTFCALYKCSVAHTDFTWAAGPSIFLLSVRENNTIRDWKTGGQFPFALLFLYLFVLLSQEGCNITDNPRSLCRGNTNIAAAGLHRL